MLSSLTIARIYKREHEVQHDTLKAYYLILFDMVLAIVLKAATKGEFVREALWLWGCTLKTMGILPQLTLFVKKVFARVHLREELCQTSWDTT